MLITESWGLKGQVNLSTTAILGTEKSGRSKEVTVVV